MVNIIELERMKKEEMRGRVGKNSVANLNSPFNSNIESLPEINVESLRKIATELTGVNKANVEKLLYRLRVTTTNDSIATANATIETGLAGFKPVVNMNGIIQKHSLFTFGVSTIMNALGQIVSYDEYGNNVSTPIDPAYYFDVNAGLSSQKVNIEEQDGGMRIVRTEVLSDYERNVTAREGDEQTHNRVRNRVQKLPELILKAITYETNNKQSNWYADNMAIELLGIIDVMNIAIKKGSLAWAQDSKLGALAGKFRRVYNNPKDPAEIKALPYLIDLDPANGISKDQMVMTRQAIDAYLANISGGLSLFNQIGAYYIKDEYLSNPLDLRFLNLNGNIVTDAFGWQDYIPINIDLDGFNVSYDNMKIFNGGKYGVIIPTSFLNGLHSEEIGVCFQRHTQSQQFVAKTSLILADAVAFNHTGKEELGLIMNYQNASINPRTAGSVYGKTLTI